jgi:hypothetical protein
MLFALHRASPPAAPLAYYPAQSNPNPVRIQHRFYGPANQTVAALGALETTPVPKINPAISASGTARSLSLSIK